MFYILDLSFLLLSALEFLRNSAIQVKFIIIIIIFIVFGINCSDHNNIYKLRCIKEGWGKVGQ